MKRLLFSIATVLIALGSSGCFRPDIANGGFTCGQAGACPDGFTCASVDNRCYKLDAGPEACSSLPPAPMCDDGPAGTDTCNPACQTGCTCGRCTVAAGTAICLAAGNKTRGQTCNPAADDCEAGLGCVREGCGTNLGRCYEFCRTGNDCADGLTCSVTLDGGFRACGLPPAGCNAQTGNGCSPGLVCYYRDLGDTTLCDCPGQQDEADTCVFYNDCIPGYTCVSISGVSTCRRLCTNGGGECTAPQTCHPLGDPYGYCR
jgi:hypothetical protein